MTRREALESLGLSGNPTPDEINRAYSECARKYHPDLYATQSEPVREVMNEKMTRVNLARETLLPTGGGEPENRRAPVDGAPRYRAPFPPYGEVTARDVSELCEMLLRNNQHEMALEVLDALIRTNGEVVAFLLLKDQVLVTVARWEEALAVLERIGELEPSIGADPDFRRHRAEVAERAGHGRPRPVQGTRGTDGLCTWVCGEYGSPQPCRHPLSPVSEKYCEGHRLHGSRFDPPSRVRRLEPSETVLGAAMQSAKDFAWSVLTRPSPPGPAPPTMEEQEYEERVTTVMVWVSIAGLLVGAYFFFRWANPIFYPPVPR